MNLTGSEPSSPGNNPPENSHVLVVDDEPTLRMGFRLALLTEGYEVEMAADGEDALRRLEEQSFNLMVLDLRMPGIDGLGVLSALAAAGRTVPTVIASAHMNNSVVLRAMALGALDFLSKPVHPAELRDVTKGLLQEESIFVAANKPASLNPVTLLRCLLRRRRPADALTTLEELPAGAKDAPGASLWRRLAEHLCTNPLPTDPDLPLRKLVNWKAWLGTSG